MFSFSHAKLHENNCITRALRKDEEIAVGRMILAGAGDKKCS
jgi:hypothetical protein